MSCKPDSCQLTVSCLLSAAGCADLAWVRRREPGRRITVRRSKHDNHQAEFSAARRNDETHGCTAIWSSPSRGVLHHRTNLHRHAVENLDRIPRTTSLVLAPRRLGQHSTTRIASCSCKKFIKPTASRKSHQLEAEPIYASNFNPSFCCGAPTLRKTQISLPFCQ